MKSPSVPDKPTDLLRQLNPHIYGPPAAAVILTPEVRKKWDRRDARLEESLAQDCLSYLRREFEGQYHVIRANPRKKSTIGKGVQDLTILLPFPTVILIELKSATGTVDPDQREHIHHMQKLGWDVHIVRSYDHFVTLVRQGFGLSTPTQPTNT